MNIRYYTVYDAYDLFYPLFITLIQNKVLGESCTTAINSTMSHTSPQVNKII